MSVLSRVMPRRAAGVAPVILRVGSLTEGVQWNPRLSATVPANPEVVVLIEYWLTGMAERGVDPQEVLNQYRAAGFDLAVLQPDGTPGVARIQRSSKP